mmetsp:Transcript_56887/g.94381  ORF Transcript_56887/g.94381 Transcript_56887/m.94381 type:complete len:207 (+) Transcript_56887:445-1065(+)
MHVPAASGLSWSSLCERGPVASPFCRPRPESARRGCVMRSDSALRGSVCCPRIAWARARAFPRRVSVSGCGSVCGSTSVRRCGRVRLVAWLCVGVLPCDRCGIHGTEHFPVPVRGWGCTLGVPLARSPFWCQLSGEACLSWSNLEGAAEVSVGVPLPTTRGPCDTGAAALIRAYRLSLPPSHILFGRSQRRPFVHSTALRLGAGPS